MNWSAYIRYSQGANPRPLLIEALKHCRERGMALDLGAGAMNEARYLADQGFKVTAVDLQPLAAENADSRINAITARIEGYEFPDAAYDLICSFFALPFVGREHMQGVMDRIKTSLRDGGVFTGQFFGPEDDWAEKPDMSFFTKEEVKELLAPLEILKLEEKLQKGKTAFEGEKQWHVFHVIARKR